MLREHAPVYYDVRAVVRGFVRTVIFTSQAALVAAFFVGAQIVPQILGADFS